MVYEVCLDMVMHLNVLLQPEFDHSPVGELIKKETTGVSI